MPDASISVERQSLAAPKGRTRRSYRALRYIPLAVAAMAMAFGLWTGLQRLGVLPFSQRLSPAELHGALMISGFLGTVISLERAVAMGRWWAYGASAISATGALALVVGFGRPAALAFVLAGAILLAITALVAFRQFAMFVVVLAIGAACWLVGSVLWLTGQSIPEVAGWWLNFLILTIAAERLELGRLRQASQASQAAFFLPTVLLVIGGARAELLETSMPLTAAGLIGLAAWLIHNDIARRTIRLSGLPRFSAVSILAGHAWLGIAGLLLALSPFEPIVFLYDAAVHAIAIGFVMSMIVGHAPIILPAVTGLRVRFSAASYAALALLHLSVLLRIMGDAEELPNMRGASATLLIVALIGYAAILIIASSRRRPPAMLSPLI
jgi:hypothetical protein